MSDQAHTCSDPLGLGEQGSEKVDCLELESHCNFRVFNICDHVKLKDDHVLSAMTFPPSHCIQVISKCTF